MLFLTVYFYIYFLIFYTHNHVICKQLQLYFFPHSAFIFCLIFAWLFVCFTILDGNFNKMLTKITINVLLFSNKGEMFSIWPLTMMLATGFLRVDFISLGKVDSFLNLLRFLNHKWHLRSAEFYNDHHTPAPWCGCPI